MSYRSIWESHYGAIPKNYDIHHIDGNRSNNDISNLKCVSLEEHYDIHYNQGDWMACTAIAMRMKISPEEKKIIHKLAMEKRDQTGNKNPMYGRSAIREKNMKWYNDGVNDSMFIEGTQPENWIIGRINMPIYDKSGSNNPKAKAVLVNNKLYACLKDVLIDYPSIPYSSLKSAALRGHSKKYKLRINYV